MATYRRLERTVLALFVVYVLAALYEQFGMGGGDREQLFPLASWSLFSKVPAEISDYDVRVLELDGEPFASPQTAQNVGDRLPALATIDAYRLIQALGRAVRKNESDAVAQTRRTLEGIYLRGAEPFRYDIVYRTYDPMLYWRDGTVRVQTVGRFDSRTQP